MFHNSSSMHCSLYLVEAGDINQLCGRWLNCIELVRVELLCSVGSDMVSTTLCQVYFMIFGAEDCNKFFLCGTSSLNDNTDIITYESLALT